MTRCGDLQYRCMEALIYIRDKSHSERKWTVLEDGIHGHVFEVNTCHLEKTFTETELD